MVTGLSLTMRPTVIAVFPIGNSLKDARRESWLPDERWCDEELAHGVGDVVGDRLVDAVHAEAPDQHQLVEVGDVLGHAPRGRSRLRRVQVVPLPITRLKQHGDNMGSYDTTFPPPTI
jgi:hypothetical protein